MLENRDSRLVKLGNQVRRGADIQNVVKRKFLSVKFLEVLIEIAVKRAGLVWIFSVPQPHRQWKGL